MVDICSPNHLHKEMALEAIRHGKHVLGEAAGAERPRRARDGRRREAEVKTLVGFNYMKNPTAQLAKRLLRAARLAR
jgi:predicted dehydrogenase